MAEELVGTATDSDSLAFEHVEAFNLLCVGESGLGKSTFLRDVFAHLDPTKIHQMKRRVAQQKAVVDSLEDAIRRNEQESKQCDDQKALTLRDERSTLKAKRDEALTELSTLRQDKRRQEEAVAELRREIQAFDEKLTDLRSRRDAEDDDDEAKALGQQVLQEQEALKQRCATLASELRRSNLDKESDKEDERQEKGQQTTEITARLIEGMPLFDGARQALDVTLIDTPGYGDMLVDTRTNSSAEKVCAEIESRISAHLGKERATRVNMPLDEEKKYWNELVHLCLFFVSPHRMKRADVDLMKRLHTLVPLVVVIAKSDTMTTAETHKFKSEVREQLEKEGVCTFVFDPKSIKQVEQLHTAGGAAEGFEPLYGGHDGQLPWAVMGADESVREYKWGSALTNEPHHSELPALRDLLLRAEGWQQLKREASLKADAEGARRLKVKQTESSWARVVGKPLGAFLTSHALPLAALALATCALLYTSSWQARHAAFEESTVEQMRRQIEVLKDDLSQCTQVRKALEGDLEEALRIARDGKASKGWWA